MANKVHCCDIMDHYVSEDKEIHYDKKLRYYSMKLHDDDYGTSQFLFYCPWCGANLPKDLDGIWSKVLKEEYGITDPNFDDADKVPEEFKTDEWWKKRGL